MDTLTHKHWGLRYLMSVIVLLVVTSVASLPSATAQSGQAPAINTNHQTTIAAEGSASVDAQLQQATGTITGTLCNFSCTTTGTMRVLIQIFAANGDQVDEIRVSERAIYPFRYRSIGLPSGRYRVRFLVNDPSTGAAETSEYYNNTQDPEQSTLVTVTAPNATNLSTTQLGIGQPITVKAQSGGAPVAGASVDIFDQRGFYAAGSQWLSGAGTDSSGSFVAGPGGVPTGSYRVRVSKCGPSGGFLPTITDSVQPGQTIQAALGGQVATPLYRIAGQVRDQSGNALIGVTLSAGGNQRWVSGIDGRFMIDCLPAGSYTLTAVKSGMTFSPATQVLAVSGNIDNLLITGAGGGTPLYSIAGTVRNSLGNPIAGVTLRTNAAQTSSSDALGRYSLNNLPAGTYTITAQHTSYRFAAPGSLTVPPDATLDLIALPAGCVNDTLTSVVSITRVTDDRGNNVYPIDTNPQTPVGTVDGNTIQATVKVENCQPSPAEGNIALDRGSATTHETITPFGTKEVTLSFPVDNLAWDAGKRPADPYSLGASFTPTSGIAVPAIAAEFSVRPRPVVLVHGYNADISMWNAYTSTALLGSLELKDIATYTTPLINTGAQGSPTNTIDQNARELAQVIEQARSTEGADQVDVIAHSMGGLITRRYLQAYATGSPVRKLIMLGTPNRGSVSAEIGSRFCLWFSLALLDRDFPQILCRTPAMQELTVTSVTAFNLQNTTKPIGTEFYVVAGQYKCDSAIPKSNPLERPYNNDVIVSTSSAFAIAPDEGWMYPPDNVGCAGRHEWMAGTGPLQGGGAIFKDYVRPLLTYPHAQGVTMAPATTQSAQMAQSTNPADLVQSTSIQTGTLHPGERLEFQRPIEVGIDGNYSFVVMGALDQMSVSLRDPNGNLYTPTTSNSTVQYMQMSDKLFPLTSYTVSSTLTGNWTTIIEANSQTPADGMPVATLGSLQSTVRLTAIPPINKLTINSPAVVLMQLRSGDLPIPGKNLSGNFVGPDGAAIAITLRDDGQNGDGVANDGIYSYRFTPKLPGVYSAVVAADRLPDAPAGRSAIWVINVEGYRLGLPLLRR